MKNALYALLTVAILAAPAVSFSQEANAPVTRAEVRGQLVQLEKAGYNPFTNNVNYPADIQLAEARVQAQDQMAHRTVSDVGVSTDGGSQVGTPAALPGVHGAYFGH
jgi:Domain of unknown function (DUF4148)